MSTQPYPIATEFEPPGPINDMWRRRAIDASAVPSKIGLHILSDYKCYFVDRLRNAVLKREAGRPLLTVSNHRCVVDDPALISVFFDFDELHRVELQRWGLCAREVCFKRPFFVPYFNAVKVFPIDRAGAGVRQQSMKNLQHRFDNAEWIHIFPEGRVVQTDDMGPLKWGSAKLLTDYSNTSGKAPMIVPFVFFGMEKTFPYARNGKWSRYRPFFGQRVRGIVGEPFEVTDLIDKFERLCAANPGWGDPWPPNREELQAAITRRTELEMLKLYERLRAVNKAELEADAQGKTFDGEAYLSSLPPLADTDVPNSGPAVGSNKRTFVKSLHELTPPPYLSLARYLHSRSSLALFNPPLVYAPAPPHHSLTLLPKPNSPSPVMQAHGPLLFEAPYVPPLHIDTPVPVPPTPLEQRLKMTQQWRDRMRAWIGTESGAAKLQRGACRGTSQFFDVVCQTISSPVPQ